MVLVASVTLSLKTASSPPVDLSPNHDEVFVDADVGTNGRRE
jgi:hypothetical protein